MNFMDFTQNIEFGLIGIRFGLDLKAIEVVKDCQNSKAKKKSSNSSRNEKFEKFKNTFLIFWRNPSRGYFPLQDFITWHHF